MAIETPGPKPPSPLESVALKRLQNSSRRVILETYHFFCDTSDLQIGSVGGTSNDMGGRDGQRPKSG
jgi:hypothetical protein